MLITTTAAGMPVPSRKTCRAAFRFWMVLAIFVLLVALLSLTGCASTPRERYNLTATAYNATAFGLAVKQEVKPFPEVLWQRIQTDEKAFTAGMTVANQWLIDNVAIADVPGAPFPPLDTLGPILAVLKVHLSNFTGIVTIPTSPKPLDPVLLPPATQPAVPPPVSPVLP